MLNFQSRSGSPLPSLEFELGPLLFSILMKTENSIENASFFNKIKTDAISLFFTCVYIFQSEEMRRTIEDNDTETKGHF